MPTRVSSTKSVERAPLPSRMEGLPAKNRPLRVPLHAIILAAQGMDGLLPESSNCLCWGLLASLKGSEASSSPNKPYSKAAQQLPAWVTLPGPSGCREVGRGEHARLAPREMDGLASRLRLVAQSGS